MRERRLKRLVPRQKSLKKSLTGPWASAGASLSSTAPTARPYPLRGMHALAAESRAEYLGVLRTVAADGKHPRSKSVAVAAMRARHESINELVEEKRDIEAHLRTLRGSPHFPGTAAGLPEDSPQIRGPTKRIEKLREIIGREKEIADARGAAWDTAAGIAHACRAG